MEEQARLNRIHSPDQSRSGVRSRAGHTPTTSTEDARITAFLEQQLQADKQQTQDARTSSGSKLGQNSNRSTPAFYNNATGRRVSATQPSPLARFPPAASAHGAMSPSSTHEKDVNLTKVEVLFFDLDGAILDWEGTVAKELRRQGDRYFPELPGVDWEAFTRLWRKYHRADMLSLAARGQSLPASTVYRTTLDELLTREGEEHTPRWTPAIREKLAEVWERCQAWPDAQEGLKAMKEIKTVATLSNWPLRTQTQMSRHAGLTWDVCLSGSLLGYYKPRPEAYKKAALSMSVDPTNCAIVSVNLDDLRGAHEAGMKTVYVRRPSEDVTDEELSKLEGSEIDLVVESFEHLAIILGCED
ncbi:HAD-like domain-containing protein [Mycena rebaudengoi]|nr:HAD-like domain-containing protein [Mycena rebaudengoi]